MFAKTKIFANKLPRGDNIARNIYYFRSSCLEWRSMRNQADSCTRVYQIADVRAAVFEVDEVGPGGVVGKDGVRRGRY